MASFTVPILMYHRLVRLKSDSRLTKGLYPYSISVQKFDKHMAFLRENEFESIQLEALIKNYSKYEKSNKKYVIITFDDGYIDNFNYAFPLLLRYNYVATFFVITSFINKSNFMKWNQLEIMLENSMKVGSHGKSHLPLGQYSYNVIYDELKDSKSLLEDKLGVKINLSSFPHGSFNSTVMQIAKNLGYLGSCSSKWGYFSRSSNLYAIERIPIKRNITHANFKNICTKNIIFSAKLKFIQELKNQLETLIGANNYCRLFNYIYANEKDKV